MISRIQVRRGTALEWLEKNPILDKGEPGFSIDTGCLKVGDGVSPWNDLQCLGSGNTGPEGPPGPPGCPGPAGANGTSGTNGSDAIPILLPNTVTDISLAATGTLTTIATVPTTAFAQAPGYFRNEGTAGNWIISVGGLNPTGTSHSIKLGPGDSALGTLGEAFKEMNLPLGAIKAFHDNPGAGGAGRLSGFVAWNDGTSPLAGPTGVRGPYGGAITLDYRFDTGTTNADPGVGYFRLNNATENTATSLFINTTSNDGVIAGTLLDNILTLGAPSAILRIDKIADPSTFLIFNVTVEVTHTGYREFTISIIASSSASPFSLNDECLLSWSPVGAPGSGGSPSTNDFRLTLAPGFPVYQPQPATPSSTDTAADTVTFSVDPKWQTGTIATVSATIGGLTAGTRYFIRRRSATLYSFHTSVAGAEGDTAKVDLTASITSEVRPSGISSTSVKATNYFGNTIFLWNGSSFVAVTSGEVSLALGTLTSGKLYDIFGFSSSGLALELGSAWTNDTTRATDIVRQNGVWVKSGDSTRRYLGTIRTDSTTTTIDDAGHLASQVGGKRFVYNGHQPSRVKSHMGAFDATTTWAYNSSTVRQADGAAGNKCEFILGLPFEDDIEGDVISAAIANASSANQGIGVDSITVYRYDGFFSQVGTVSGVVSPLVSRWNGKLDIGYHYVAWLESSPGASATFVGYNGSGDTSRSGLLVVVMM